MVSYNDDEVFRIEDEIDADDGEVCDIEQVLCEDKEVEKETVKKDSKTNKENALECFGLDEIKSEKWMIKFGKFWYDVMSFVWLIFGAVTFSFVIFISQKIDVLFNNKKRSLWFSVGIYAAIVAFIVMLILI